MASTIPGLRGAILKNGQQDRGLLSNKRTLVTHAKNQNFSELIKLSGLNPRTDLRFGDWPRCDFAGCNLRGYDFSGARLWGCNFEGAKILGACFDGAEIDHVSLYTGDNIGVHGPKPPRMSPLRQADDWEEYKKDWPLISRSSPDATGELAIGEVVMDERRIPDNHLPTGAVFQDAPFTPEMVMVPSGTFMMGSPKEEGDGNEHPQHDVTISQRFAISRYAVTFEEWDDYVAQTDNYKPESEGWGRGRRPVINISWNDVQEYIKWLSKQTRYTYRLPTEAEWEYACRAGTTTKYAFGNNITTQQARFDAESGKTTEVGKFPANDFGLFDMHGNVREWCNDWYGDYEEGLKVDPQGLSSGTFVVNRGGSWYSGAKYLRSAYRFNSSPDVRGNILGFRLLRQVS